MDDPLDFVDFADILQHGDPGKWKFKGHKAGSPAPATSPLARPGTMKNYEIYEGRVRRLIELHYFRHTDGSVGDVKVKT